MAQQHLSMPCGGGNAYCSKLAFYFIAMHFTLLPTRAIFANRAAAFPGRCCAAMGENLSLGVKSRDFRVCEFFAFPYK
jgi:hypothetical protein